MKYDITAIYKLIHNHFDIHYTDFFELVTDNNTRGHRFKVYKRHCVVNAYKHSFPNRCIDIWNNLPADVVESLSISHFKNRLDEVNLQRYCKLFLWYIIIQIFVVYDGHYYVIIFVLHCYIDFHGLWSLLCWMALFK